jgi:dTDP-4-dehydrorhamnose 3,5-epimerase
MTVTPTALPDVLLIEPRVFGDSRGYFKETFQLARYREAGINLDFVQDNVSTSQQNVIRGLHFQTPNGQGKLVQVLSGAVYDVVVDIRSDSKSFGQWIAYELSEENHRQLWIPPGFAHGFAVLSPSATFVYKCTEYYHAAGDRSLLWKDPEIGINWPIAAPTLSARDEKGTPLRDFPSHELPRIRG